VKDLALATLLTATLLASLPGSVRADGPPGRVVTLSVGGGLNTSGKDDAVPMPDLLRISPELQIGFGIALADSVVLTTQVDLLGALVSIGVGVDLSVAWAPLLSLAPSWGPIVRIAGGAFLYAQGGEVGVGSDYEAYGFRFAGEAGAMFVDEVNANGVAWALSATIGAQLVGLPSVGPCESGTDCSDVLFGGTLRGHAHLFF
jgi:hypothetical protein